MPGKFFSLNSDGFGTPYYFDYKARKRIEDEKLSFQLEGHTSIAYWFGYEGRDEDILNKYEYNPLTKHFRIDRLNVSDDSKKIEKFCNELDFKTVFPDLIIKPVIHPFEVKVCKRFTDKDLQILGKWIEVGTVVRASVGDSIRDSIRISVYDTIWNEAGASIWDRFLSIVGMESRDSVMALMWAYTSSFFNIPKWKYINHKVGKNPFQPAITLWEKGLLPVYEGCSWSLFNKHEKL